MRKDGETADPQEIAAKPAHLTPNALASDAQPHPSTPRAANVPETTITDDKPPQPPMMTITFEDFRWSLYRFVELFVQPVPESS